MIVQIKIFFIIYIYIYTMGIDYKKKYLKYKNKYLEAKKLYGGVDSENLDKFLNNLIDVEIKKTSDNKETITINEDLTTFKENLSIIKNKLKECQSDDEVRNKLFNEFKRAEMTLVAEEDAVKAKQKEKIDKIRTEKAKAKNINFGKF